MCVHLETTFSCLKSTSVNICEINPTAKYFFFMVFDVNQWLALRDKDSAYW